MFPALLNNSCSKKKLQVNNIRSESPFSPVFEDEIDKFILFNKENGLKGANIYRISSYKSGGDCLLFLDNDLFYDKKYAYVYTIFDGYLLVYDLFDVNDTICVNGVVNFQKMTKFKDSISGFKGVHNSIIPKYDAYTRTFKIISPDSLEIISTSR